MNRVHQLILLPGLGADRRLLEPQFRAFPHLIVPSWIPPEKNESLPAYAKRLAMTISVRNDVPLILGGVSLGGMLAFEMARYLKPQAVVLIASCRTREALPSIYIAAKILLPLIPIQAWNLAKLLAAPAVQLRADISNEHRQLAVRMFREMDARLMHSFLDAILHWHPLPMEETRVLHIHGARDRIIPARRVHADEVVSDGGHLINVTHAAQVNRFIEHAIASNG